MGLFDKLREAIGKGENSSLKNNPLQDEAVRKYYEMIYGMRTYLAWSGNESSDENSRALRYVEFMLGEPCDQERFKKAVELTNLARTDYPKTELEKELKELNKSLRPLEKYKCDSVTACRVCYKELVSDIKVDYESILNIIKDNINCEHFGEGLKKKILDKYKNIYQTTIVTDCISVAIIDSFFDGNNVTRKILFDLLVDIFNNRVNESSNDPYHYLSAIHAFALSAIHFEKYGKEREGYVSITYDECREHILKFENYVRDIDNHLFEKEEYTQKLVDKIRGATVFNVRYSSYDGPCVCWIDNRNEYFFDALCNYAWKEIAKMCSEENIDVSADPKSIANMLYGFFLNN